MSDVVDAFNAAVDEVEGKNDANNPSGMSVESLTLFMTTQRVNQLEDEMRSELRELKERQAKVRRLHELLKAINAATDENDELDWEDDEEMKALLDEARELGIDIPEGKYKFSSAERQRMVENVRMTIDDFNLENDMQIQTVTRLQNERYEAYQMARSIMKPLHEDKVNKARKLAG